MTGKHTHIYNSLLRLKSLGWKLSEFLSGVCIDPKRHCFLKCNVKFNQISFPSSMINSLSFEIVGNLIILIGYFMALTCISLIFSLDTLYFPRDVRPEWNTGRKYWGKTRIKPCLWNLFIPCVEEIFFGEIFMTKSIMTAS